MQNERIKELFLGLTLVIFLILLSVLVISISDNSYSKKQSNIISNSYNINSYNTISQNKQTPYYGNRIYIKKDIRYLKQSNPYSKTKYLRFSGNAYQTRTKGIFGNDINKYSVYVKNQDYKGGYFTVRYYLKDYYGNVKTERITHYISPRESKQFLLKDISPKEYGRVSWNYEIISHSKKPIKIYYNSDAGFQGNVFYGSPTRTYFYLN